MKYRIASESAHRIRLRLCAPPLTAEQAEVLRYAFSSIGGVRKVTIYRETAGCALEYAGDRETILGKIDRFRFENVRMMAAEIPEKISADEMRRRKLAPEVKRKLRLRIAVETAADLILPAPVQVMYHLYQLITLKEL